MTGCHNIRTEVGMRIHFSLNVDIDSKDICTRIKHIDLLFNFPKEKLYEKYNNKYVIIPFGTNCFARVLTSINGIKPYKKDGEKTCPFDQVCSNFENNVELLKNDFEDFFENLELREREVDNKNEIFYKNTKYKIDFIHEPKCSLEEFKDIYQRRIKNFYNYLNDKEKLPIFLITHSAYPKKEVVEDFIHELKRYRKDFSIIIFNTSSWRVKWKLKQVQVVNFKSNKCFNKMGSTWVPQLKGLTNIRARIVNNQYASHVFEIIDKEMSNFCDSVE